MMEFYRVWQILISHRWVLIWLPIVATVVGLACTYVLPEQYESTALVLVRPFEDIKFNSGDGDKKGIPDFPLNLSAPVDAPSKTYMEVIKSPAVAVKIVEALQLQNKRPREYESLFASIKDKVKTWVKDAIRMLRNYSKYGRDIPASPFEQAVEDIENNLIATARKDTYAFEITYRSGDPNEAAAVANMAAEIFLEQSSEAYRSESARARDFIKMQLDESRQALEQTRAAMLTFKNSGGTFELSSEYNEKLKSVSDLENMLAKTVGKLAGLKRAYGKSSSGEGGPNVIAQEAEIAELKEQIFALRGQLIVYPEKEKQMNAITLNEHLAEKSYEFFLEQYQQARVKESSTVTEIRIASRAVPGLYPVKPLKYIYAGLSFAVALVAAIGWALFAESLDPRVRRIRDLDEELDLPVLGAIPALKRF